MKRIIILSVILFVAVTFNAEAKRHYHGVGGFFYTELSPYGSWIEVDYGVVVWRPTIIRVDWMPYQVGRWVWTCDGWYWDSYEPYGYITYHYGRWYYDDYYGWLWYPDYEWAPAWVEWRYDNDYIGWAPLHPYASFSISVGIIWTNVYYTPYYQWNFVMYGNFCDPYVYNYYVPFGNKYRIHSGTRYRNNFVYYDGRIQNKGIDRDYISVRSGQDIKERDIIRVRDSKELSRDGNRNRDEIRKLDIDRDELMKNDLGRMEIKRGNRKTSVDMEKVKIGRRENVTGELKKDNSKNRTLDGLKTDQIKKDTKEVVNKVFDQKKSQDNRNTDQNDNTKNINFEKSKRETEKTKNFIYTKKKNTEISIRDENRIKKQNTNNTSQSIDLNKKQQEQTKQLKKGNNTTTRDQVNNDRVKEENGNDNQKSKTTDIKEDSNRKKVNDSTRDRSRK